MGLQPSQIKHVARITASLISGAMFWEEAMNGDDIEEFVEEFKKELKEQNGDV